MKVCQVYIMSILANCLKNERIFCFTFGSCRFVKLCQVTEAANSIVDKYYRNKQNRGGGENNFNRMLYLFRSKSHEWISRCDIRKQQVGVIQHLFINVGQFFPNFILSKYIIKMFLSLFNLNSIVVEYVRVKITHSQRSPPLPVFLHESLIWVCLLVGKKRGQSSDSSTGRLEALLRVGNSAAISALPSKVEVHWKDVKPQQ